MSARFTHRTSTIAAIAFAAICATTSLFAQQAITSATLSGRIVDASSSVVSKAQITLTNVDTNQQRTAVADAQGRFRFAFLPVGKYALAVEHDGFAPWAEALTLTVGAAVEVPVSLTVAAAEEIDVHAATPVIETARTQVSTTITPEEVHDLPLNGRNYLDLALLAPGVSRTNTGATQRFAETSAVPGTGISVSTQRNLANSFIVDGLSSNDDAAELAGTFYSQEVIQEFAVVRSGGIAEFGRSSGGVINIVTQSGTNALRADAYDFFRNQKFDGANALTHTRLPLDQKQYGASVSGPLVRDRSFLFANVEQMSQNTGGVLTITPANAAAINARLDAIGYRGERLTTGTFDTTLDSRNAFGRLDHAVSERDHLTMRFSSYDVSSDNARNVGGLSAVSRGAGLTNADRTLAVSNLWTVSDSAISESRAQSTRSRLSAPVNDVQGPAVNISGIASFGTATSSPTARDINMFEGAESITWMHGNHSLKAGADLLRNDVTIAFPGALQGVYTFTNLANFLAGKYASFQQAFGEPVTQQRNDNGALFLQDEWRVTPRVTVNAGLRYDIETLALVDTQRDLSPRLGMAWDVTGNGRSVLRASGGRYYGGIPLRAISNAIERDGINYRVAQVGPNAAGAPVFPNIFSAFPSGILTNITTIDPHMKSSYSDQLGLQYEHQIGSAVSGSIGYEHLRGHDIIMSRNVNVPTTTDPKVPNLGRPNSAYANNSQFQSIGDSWYDGVTVSLNKKPAPWGSFRVSYTFSKGLDTSGNFFFSQPQDASNIAAERGRSDNDQRHRLSFSGTLTSPLGPGDTLFRQLTHGWMFSYIYSYASALPFNIQLPNDRNGDTNFNDRPAGVGRNTGRGFGSQTLDLRVSRTFALTQRASIEAMVDAFNVLNHANYQVPNNIFGSPTFGKPTAAGDPRQLQFGLRVIF